MKSFLTPFIRISILFVICQVQLASQNVGIGTNNPSAKLHLQSTVQTNSSLDLNFETGTIDPANNLGDNDWYITGTDGYNSIKSAKAPLIFNSGENALLAYFFDVLEDKEITVSFAYKYDDPTDQVAFTISNNGFSFSPPSAPDWKYYSTTYASQSASDALKISVNALQDEAFPIVHIDNIMITYEDGHVLKIEDGTEADGFFLQSDALGQTEWHDLRGEIDQKINDNLQDLEFDTTQNALGIENANFVLIPALKNNFGKSLVLSENEITVSPGMSLHLPGSNSSFPSLHFDAVNKTMDWGQNPDSNKGEFSTRWGNNSTASNTYSTAWGDSNNATGVNSTSWGTNSLASGLNSTSWGLANWAIGENSTSFGSSNSSDAELSTSWGHNTIASGFRSTNWGFFTRASGINSTAWGESNEATEENSTSFGRDNLSSAELTTSWGLNNVASSDISTSWGAYNNVSGINGTSWGRNNEATALRSTTWGTTNEASEENSTACGHFNSANGANSFVSGYRNDVNTYAEVAFGRWNESPSGDPTSWISSDILFSLGNGTSSSNRKNAVSVLKNGNVGIGVDAPTYDLHLLNDSAAKPGGGEWTVSSDRRLKKDISAFTDGLDIISAIEPVWFTYNGLADIPERTFVGTIAQDLEEIAPYMVSEFTHRDDEGNSENYKAVNYSAMNFVLINAIKELKQENIKLKAQIEEILSLLNAEKDMGSSSEDE